MNSYTKYYVNQAGTGLAGYQGVKYQRGHGYFGRIFSNIFAPVLKYLGKQALNTGLNVMDDVVLQGKNLKESSKERFRGALENITGDAVSRGRQYLQTNSGRKRRRKSIKRLSKRKKSIKRKKPIKRKRKLRKKKDIDFL